MCMGSPAFKGRNRAKSWLNSSDRITMYHKVIDA